LADRAAIPKEFKALARWRAKPRFGTKPAPESARREVPGDARELRALRSGCGVSTIVKPTRKRAGTTFGHRVE